MIQVIPTRNSKKSWPICHQCQSGVNWRLTKAKCISQMPLCLVHWVYLDNWIFIIINHLQISCRPEPCPIANIPWRESILGDVSRRIPRISRLIYIFIIIITLNHISAQSISKLSSMKFNLTMTYRLDSDLPSPYAMFVKRDETNKSNFTVLSEEEFYKKKGIAWMVSHCSTVNRREAVGRWMTLNSINKYGFR